MTTSHQSGRVARLAGSVLLGMAVGAAATAPAAAKELRYAVGLAESSYNYDAAVAFAEAVAETSDLTVKVFSLSLLSLGEIPGGIRDGLADFGYTLFPYFPAEFSEANLPADLALLSTSGTEAKLPGPAMIGASIEYIMLNCPECQTQMKGLNTVYLSGGASVDYGLVCNKPVKSLADIKGKKIRTGAADLGRFVEYFGGTRVALSGNEIYDALSTGNVDCSANTPENLTGLRYIEIVDHFTHLMPGSMFAGLGTANMNRDSWIDLTEEQRRAVLNAAAKLSVISWNENKVRNEVGIKAMQDAGKNVYTVTDEDRAEIAKFVDQDIDVVRAQYVEKYGLKNVDEKITLIRDLIEKWKGLTNGVENDVDAITKLYIDEVYSKIDVATYGVQ